MDCPCGTKNRFENCCGPFLAGEKLPSTAEQLMRSRYTAVTRAEIEYMEKTLVPEHRHNFNAHDAKEWATQSKWKALNVIKSIKGKANHKTGTVEFIATYEKDGIDIDHHEISQFRKDSQDMWLYIDGQSHTHKAGEDHSHNHNSLETFNREHAKIGRNDPCHCGSSKKYKKCCGTGS